LNQSNETIVTGVRFDQSELIIVNNYMIDVKKLFDELKEKKPYWSDIVIFNTCIT
jgi:hypothetical protein